MCSGCDAAGGGRRREIEVGFRNTALGAASTHPIQQQHQPDTAGLDMQEEALKTDHAVSTHDHPGPSGCAHQQGQEVSGAGMQLQQLPSSSDGKCLRDGNINAAMVDDVDMADVTMHPDDDGMTPHDVQAAAAIPLSP